MRRIIAWRENCVEKSRLTSNDLFSFYYSKKCLLSMANRVLRNSSNFHVPFPRNNTFHKVSNDINSSFSCWESESNSLRLHVSRNRIRIINCSERTAQKDALDCEGRLMIVRAREITADLPWTEWPPRGSISAMPQRHRQRRRRRRRRRRLSPPSPRPSRIWRSW